MDVKIKERVLWADVCKGLLITLLMFNHLTWLSKSQYHIDNQAINVISTYGRIWSCFFMSCFFVISGMFSNFDKPGKGFVWKQFKALIVPALVLLLLLRIPSLDYVDFWDKSILYGGGQWFLSSLFLSKVFFWGCVKWIKKEWLILALLLIMSFAGKLLDDINIFPNYWYHRNFLHFTLFLGLGYFFKDYIINKKVGVVSALFFVLSILVLFAGGFRVPNVVSVFNENFFEHPLSIWLSITGSISCIHFCKMIGRNSILEHLGKISLIVYIYHMNFLSHSISALSVSLEGCAIIDSTVQIFMIITSTLVFSCFVSWMLDYKYLKWMKGDF